MKAYHHVGTCLGHLSYEGRKTIPIGRKCTANKVKLTPYTLFLSATRLKKVLRLNRDLFCLRQLTLYRGAHGEGWGSVPASIDDCCQGGQFSIYANNS